MSDPPNPTPSPFLRRTSKRRQIDFEIMVDWIGEGSSVLDLGCGRGVLLKELAVKKNVQGVGVDSDPVKIASCLRKGVNVFQGDAAGVLGRFDDGAFDFVVFSRTLEMIGEPGVVIGEALRVGRSVLVGTINHGYWFNRLHFLVHGGRARNSVYPLRWEDSPLTNHLSVGDLKGFVRRSGLRINRAIYLRGNWKSRCRWLAAWRSGYAIFEIARSPGAAAEA